MTTTSAEPLLAENEIDAGTTNSSERRRESFIQMWINEVATPLAKVPMGLTYTAWGCSYSLGFSGPSRLV